MEAEASTSAFAARAGNLALKRATAGQPARKLTIKPFKGASAPPTRGGEHGGGGRGGRGETGWLVHAASDTPRAARTPPPARLNERTERATVVAPGAAPLPRAVRTFGAADTTVHRPFTAPCPIPSSPPHFGSQPPSHRLGFDDGRSVGRAAGAASAIHRRDRCIGHGSISLQPVGGCWAASSGSVHRQVGWPSGASLPHRCSCTTNIVLRERARLRTTADGRCPGERARERGSRRQTAVGVVFRGERARLV